MTFQNSFFFLFFKKIGFVISCKLSPKQAICMKCQNLFSKDVIKETVSMKYQSLFFEKSKNKFIRPFEIVFFFFFKKIGCDISCIVS